MIQGALGVICIMGWKSPYYLLKTTMYLVQMSNILSFILTSASIPKQISILKGLGLPLKVELVFNLTEDNPMKLSSSVQDLVQD